MSLGLAFKAMFRVLGDADFAQKVKGLIDGSEKEPEQVVEAVPAAPRRSEALTLLAALQRDARFLDFVMENLDGYADAQVGAAVRDVHRDCAKTIARMFAVKPLTKQAENTPIEVPVGFDPVAYHLTGNVQGEAPFKGTVRHHGWQAERCDVPEWTGQDASVMIAAPVEVEL